VFIYKDTQMDTTFNETAWAHNIKSFDQSNGSQALVTMQKKLIRLIN